MSSLYIFDALSRAARNQVTKLGLTGSVYSEKGNCATFLLKVEGVLEGLFQDMLTIGTEESKVSHIHPPPRGRKDPSSLRPPKAGAPGNIVEIMEVPGH